MEGIKLLSDQAKEARRLYKKKWRESHPENVRRSEQKFWEKKAAELAKETDPEGTNDDI